MFSTGLWLLAKLQMVSETKGGKVAVTNEEDNVCIVLLEREECAENNGIEISRPQLAPD